MIVRLLILVLFFALPAHAQDVKPDFASFEKWPVLHDGRVKTMDSFARSSLYQISGKTNVHGMSAIEWLATGLFDPSSSIGIPVIRVRANSLLELPKNDDHLYSMNDVMSALNPHQDLILALETRDRSTLSASQKELLTVYQSVTLYNQIIQSFSAVLPLSGFAKNFIEGGGSREQRILIAEGGLQNNLLKFMPNDHPHMTHVSLWRALDQEDNGELIQEIAIMAKAWNDGDYQTWNAQTEKIGNILNNQIQNAWRLDMESIYVSIDPLFWVMILYGVGVVLMPFYKKLSITFIFSGMVAQFIAMISRAVILERMPLGTLYETILFGAMIVAAVGLVLFMRNRENHLILVGCTIAAAFLIFVSRGFIQGDSLSVLVAVLNTNFWLSTHVTCIIVGYGMCIIASVLAHLYLLTNNTILKKYVLPMGVTALLFTSIGTLLGGIWADQSWGRFWGWDPKENGALLIVLWLIWVIHGRWSGHFRDERVFASMMALTNIMVALTWFGVNLLGVGLHSYGFISGIAWGLGAFCTAQIVIIVMLYFYHRRTYAS